MKEIENGSITNILQFLSESVENNNRSPPTTTIHHASKDSQKSILKYQPILPRQKPFYPLSFPSTACPGS